jgi:hypothetical protein
MEVLVLLVLRWPIQVFRDVVVDKEAVASTSAEVGMDAKLSFVVQPRRSAASITHIQTMSQASQASQAKLNLDRSVLRIEHAVLFRNTFAIFLLSNAAYWAR